MNNIQKRKKRFWAVCLALLLVLVQVVPADVFATDYTLIDQNKLDDGNGNLISTGDIVYKGDRITYKTNGRDYYRTISIAYNDQDGNVITSISSNIPISTAETQTAVGTVTAYPTNLTNSEAFKGWKITNIVGSSGYLGGITFDPVFYTLSTITYVNTEGAINPNPDTYYEGKEEIPLADATKAGYTFAGWYIDGDSEKKVTSITTGQTGAITLYARFVRDGVGSITVDDVYYGDTISPVVASSTNGTDNVTITYKKKGEPDSSYTETKPTKVGQYTARAVFGETDEYTEAIATDDFSILKKKGEGVVSVADICLGDTPQVVVASPTNGIEHVTIQFKKKDAPDSTYSAAKPDDVGTYTVRAIFAQTEYYQEVIATNDFTVSYMNQPENPYQVNGTKGKNDYYISLVTIIPAKGFLISDSRNGIYKNQLELMQSVTGYTIYLKKGDTGEITSPIGIPTIKIDRKAPVILNAESGSTIFKDELEVIVQDENLSQVLVNNKEVSIKDGKAILNLSSNQGKESYEIVSVDSAGNVTKSNFVLAASWMKSMIIPIGQKVRLYADSSYKLGSGSWMLAGDSTIYAGNSTFYVDSDGDYSFSKAN